MWHFLDEILNTFLVESKENLIEVLLQKKKLGATDFILGCIFERISAGITYVRYKDTKVLHALCSRENRQSYLCINPGKRIKRTT